MIARNFPKAGLPQPNGSASTQASSVQASSVQSSPILLKLKGTAHQAIETGRTRLRLVAHLFAVLFVVLGWRIFDLAILSDYQAGGSHAGAQASIRADITDRNGVILATSMKSSLLHANARQIIDPALAAKELVALFPEMSEQRLRRRLSSKAEYVALKRNLSPREMWQVNALGIPGLHFEEQMHRIYPLGRLAVHAVGFVNRDSVGKSGVERYFDDDLGGSGNKDKRVRSHGAKSGQKGEPLALSLDVRVQHILREELLKAIDQFRATAAGGLVMDVENGEVLAMVSLPDFDPNNIPGKLGEAAFNRMTLLTYEMGSTFKVFNTAIALDSGVVNMNSAYDATDPIRISSYTIRDDHAQNRRLTVPEILIHSSNIGSAKMALDIGKERQRDYLSRLGLLGRAAIELPERGRPLTPQNWGESTTMTVSYGYGLSVTPLHVATGFSAMVNGGNLVPATLVHDRKPGGQQTIAVPRQVISAATSDKIRSLMRRVVTQGTGGKADAAGYFVGGKTGTAERISTAGGYSESALVTSFVGAFPTHRPRYLVMAMVEDPKGNKDTFNFAGAGWTAAPVVGKTISRIGPLLGLAPVSPEQMRLQQLAWSDN